MKSKRIVFWTSTILLALLMFFSAFNYFFQHAYVLTAFEALEYPGYLIYPLGILKILGILTLLIPGFKILKHWAYAGFTINFSLALVAHAYVGDGEWGGALVALILLYTSFIFRNNR
ncbi:MAG: DoxX family protein [Flavobacteriaceae bacterium]